MDVKSTFLAGVKVIVPAAAAAWVVGWLIDVLSAGILLVPAPLRPSDPLVRDVLGAGLALVAVLVVGLVVQRAAGAALVAGAEALLRRVPLVAGVHDAVRQFLDAMTVSGTTFRSAVIIEWPRPGTWTIGFVTGHAASVAGREVVGVYVPTTPNPTSGFYVLMDAAEVAPTDLTVEEAFKAIVTGGLVVPDRGVTVPPAFVVRNAARLEADAAAHPRTMPRLVHGDTVPA